MSRLLLRIENLELQEAGRDLLVHDVANRRIHVLNASAGTILKLCDGTRDAAAIVDALALNASVDRTVVECDVDRVLEDFERLGLLLALNGQ